MPSITSPSPALNRAKRADLTSGVGALVLGVGVGALFPRIFGTLAIAITIVGASLHAFGMWDKHRIDAEGSNATPVWVSVLYWICWLMLGALLVVMIIR